MVAVLPLRAVWMCALSLAAIFEMLSLLCTQSVLSGVRRVRTCMPFGVRQLARDMFSSSRQLFITVVSRLHTFNLSQGLWWY